jgi:hypothetical protein
MTSCAWYSDLSMSDIIGGVSVLGIDDAAADVMEKLTLFDDEMYKYIIGLKRSRMKTYRVCVGSTGRIKNVMAYSAIHAVYVYMVSISVLFPLCYDIHCDMNAQELTYILRRCYAMLKEQNYIKYIKERD